MLKCNQYRWEFSGTLSAKFTAVFKEVYIIIRVSLQPLVIIDEIMENCVNIILIYSDKSSNFRHLLNDITVARQHHN